MSHCNSSPKKPLTPPLPNPEMKTHLGILRQKIVDLVEKSPEKAAKILSYWIKTR